MAQSLELLLIQFLMPDNDARRQAEEQIRRLARDPQVVPALVHHLRTAKTPNVRQLAAVLLRKKITSHWPKLPPHAKASLKQALIDSITIDHSHLVRRASANVVSIIAKYAVPAGEWPELLPFIFQCSQSPQEDHREVALILFSSLTETIGTTFQSHLNDLQPILLKCLQDEASSRVRIAALKAVGSFIEYVNDGGDVVKMFRDFVPSILNVSRQCLANGEEDVASIAFEIFDELIESPAPLLGDSVRSIVQFSLEVCSNQELEINIRQQAIQIISWLVKFKASFLKKHKLVIPILQVMCPLLTETADEDGDSDLAADRSAAEVIDTMAINLPRHVFPPVLEFASVSFHHINPKYREAAVTSLGVVSEGCCEHLKDKLEDCLKVVLEALKDQEQMVRGAASFALGQFAEHLQPEILSHYESVLPCILNALEDPSDEVKEKSYYALAAFCEDMGENILPYLDPLMCRLVMSLQGSPRNLQETCMSAIGSVAAAAEQAFMPYAEKVLEMMKGFMVLTNDEDLCARARATEVVGIVAMAVGRARMETILPPFIEAAISGFVLDYSELREYTHGFFSNVAEILDDSFAQYLPHVVPLAFSSCNLDDGSAVDIDDADSVDNGFSGVSSDDDVNDEPRKSPHPPQDKTMVVATLAEVAQGMGAPISAYVDKIMPLVLKELASSEATNRRNAAFCVGEMCKNGGAAALKYYGDILHGLHRLFADSEPDDAVRDNAAGAIARMIMVQPQSIPLNQVLPVFIKALPLKEDHEESMVVYSCVCNLLLSSHPQILPLVPDVINAFAQVVVSPNESDEVKTVVAKAVSHLISVYGQQMQPILSALPPAHANALASFANRR
uniref:Importin N-terminal domain-containing protein n=1 Tax=Oryza barthii TaxID=65489 RepID=A0A0D3FGH5_9ORYZ